MLRPTLMALVLACVLASEGFAADGDTTQAAPAGAGDANAAATTAAEPAPKELEPVERQEEKVADMGSRWDENVIVCRSIRVTGSRQRHRVCHSRGEWAAMRSNAEETMRYINNQPTSVPGT